MSYFSASLWQASARTMAPYASSATASPEANDPPPVDTWMMPSEPASANALRAPLMVASEVMLMAGYA